MLLPAAVADFLRENSVEVAAVLVAVNLLMLLVVLYVLARIARLNRFYKRLMRGTTGGNLEERLNQYMDCVEQAAAESGAMQERVAQVEQAQRRCLTHVGFVRFDAFEGIGGEQSFAIAVTDREQNGFALSSVYSRTDVRVYAKAISGGQPSHPLTEEERRALAQAEGR